MLKDYKLPPANGAPARRAVIFLHGLGDSGSGGLLSIGQIWQPHLPDCEFLCPDAPFAYDMVPDDFGDDPRAVAGTAERAQMRQWFSLRNFERSFIYEGVKQAAPILNDYIEHVMQTRNLTSDKIALVGFSQGTMMALYTALRRTDSVACIVGYSGMMIGGEDLAAEAKSKPPILLVHGTHDDVVPYGMMEEAERILKQNGFAVQALTCPGPGIPHTIDETGLLEGLRFIKQAWDC